MLRVYLQAGRCIYCGAYGEHLMPLCGFPAMLCEDCTVEGEMEDDDADDALLGYVEEGDREG